MISYDVIRKDSAVNAYIAAADSALAALGYTEHNIPHLTTVAERAADILKGLGYDGHTVELARIAGYLHDIGNVVNRVNHSQSGALIAFDILNRYNMPSEDIAEIISAIGNHDEGTGVPISPIAAALIIADKSDVRKSRVRNPDARSFDIHDRVNFSVMESALALSRDRSEITLVLAVDTAVSPIMDYFEIFLERMKLCRAAAIHLGIAFHLFMNGQQFA